MSAERKKARVVMNKARSRIFSVGVAGARSLQPKSAGLPLEAGMGVWWELGWILDSQRVRRVWAIHTQGVRRRMAKRKSVFVRLEIKGLLAACARVLEVRPYGVDIMMPYARAS
jgi:hypothetical protein